MFVRVHVRDTAVQSDGKSMEANSGNIEFSCHDDGIDLPRLKITFTEFEERYHRSKYEIDTATYKCFERKAEVELSRNDLNKIIEFMQKQHMLSVVIKPKEE